MATIITAEPLRWGSRLPRASINGHQFIETEKLKFGSRLPNPAIGSSRDIHSVIDWTPDDLSEGHPVGGPVTVNFEANNSEELIVEFDEGVDFENGGTHDNTETLGDAVNLKAVSTEIDFEDYTVDDWLNATSHPEQWTNRSPYLGHRIRDRLSPTNRLVEGQFYNQELIHSHDPTGDVAGGVVSTMIYFPNSTSPRAGVFFLTTGSGSALRGHGMTIALGATLLSTYRMNAFDYWFGLGSRALGFTVQQSTWYHLKAKFWRSDTSITFQFKCWEDGDPEPANFSTGASDTVYVQDGAVGIMTKHSVASEIGYLDDFSFNDEDPTYPTSGEWTSDPIDVSSVETFSSGILTFDKTTPANTTATLSARWHDGEPWTVCTSGDPVPTIGYRDDMSAGSNRAALQFRIELATTDTSITPELSNLHLYFDPCRFADVDLDVDGNLATIANGHLAKWGREQVSGGVEIVAFDDLTVQAHTLKSYRLRGESILSTFSYQGREIDSIIFAQLVQAFRIATGGDAYFGFSGQAGAREANTLIQWTAKTDWWKTLHDYEWILIDKTQGIHADALYRIGHPRTDDFLGSVLVAVAEQADFPGTILAKAYQRDDFPGTLLVQGWQLDDLPGSVLAALQSSNDFPGSIVVGIGRQDDFPGELLVYGVNRNNVIEIHTIDSDTLAELQLIGFVFPPEV